MSFEEEKEAALGMLRGIELGEATADESYERLNEADATLVFFLFKWLRKRYRDHDSGPVVMARLNEVRNNYRSLTRKAKAGEDDPVVGWFEGTYAYQDLEAEEFIDIIVEKLEG